VFTGTRVGAYEILEPIGSGGMGHVYRARDTKLYRDVALKFLPPHLAMDADRLSRFRREAQTLAALNRPDIAQIYGLEESNGTYCIAMELVEGETVAERLRHGPIAIDEALRIGHDIAEALEAAHDKGVIHRDLKPANIKLTPEGQVKVLDFGLAKMLERESPESDLSDSPTLTGTLGGVIMGTAAYMSPEQARGQQVDRASDVWAFGCVLYEMLSGRRAFPGETVTDILGSILKVEPDWSALPKDAPPGTRRLLGRCLQKDRKQRLRDIRDARIDLEETPGEWEAVTASRSFSHRFAWAAALLALAVAAWFALFSRKAPDAGPEQRLEVNTPATTAPGSFAVSPDGRKLVFVATSEGQKHLWLRSLDSVTAQPLARTEGAELPFWSPDSQSIGFFADSKLKRIDIVGGSVQTLTEAILGGGLGGSWNKDGVIIFNARPGFPLSRVSDKGGDSVPATRLDSPRQANHSRPHFLPDGRHFLLYAAGSPERRGVYLGSLDSLEIVRLFESDSPAVFVRPEYVLYIRQQTLFASRLDMTQFQPVGPPSPITQQVGAVSASASGVIAYRIVPTGPRPTLRLSWFDRLGKSSPLLVDAGGLAPELSPDDTRVAVHRADSQGNYDVWLLDTTNGKSQRLTSDPVVEGFPTWSPDGRRVVFASTQGGELRVKRVSGADTPQVLWKSSDVLNPTDWSADGRYLLFQSRQVGVRDIYALQVDADAKPVGKPVPVAADAKFDEREGQFSPDGRWVAYQSNETGRFEIYLQAFPSLDTKLPITGTGGVQARWRSDGRELFYLAPDGKLMSVQMTPSVKGNTVHVGSPKVLFRTNWLLIDPTPDVNGHSYDVSANGQRFVAYDTTGEPITIPITLILNWKPPAK
jgi:eukaryotic-like serine/threonine-protein kinase